MLRRVARLTPAGARRLLLPMGAPRASSLCTSRGGPSDADGSTVDAIAAAAASSSSLPPPTITGPTPPIGKAIEKVPRRISKRSRNDVDAYELVHLTSFLGFSTRRTHPTAYNYLLGTAGGQAIIDPEETLTSMRRALQLVKKVTFRGGRVLFVSTQPTLARLTRVVGEQSGQFYLAKRWVPGLLTNWQKSREHIHAKLTPDPALEAAGKLKFSDLQKANYFRGVEKMTRPPDLIFRLDSTPLYGEPEKLNVPLISVVDTDTPGSDVDYPIPANSRSLRFYHTLAHMLVRACNEGTSLRSELQHYGVESYYEKQEEDDDKGGGGRGMATRGGGRGGDQPRGRGGGRQQQQRRGGSRSSGGDAGSKSGSQGGTSWRTPNRYGNVPR